MGHADESRRDRSPETPRQPLAVGPSAGLCFRAAHPSPPRVSHRAESLRGSLVSCHRGLLGHRSRVCPTVGRPGNAWRGGGPTGRSPAGIGTRTRGRDRRQNAPSASLASASRAPLRSLRSIACACQANAGARPRPDPARHTLAREPRASLFCDGVSVARDGHAQRISTSFPLHRMHPPSRRGASISMPCGASPCCWASPCMRR